MADRAFLRCIGKIHKYQRYASYGCLVGHELAKLSEAPGCTVTSLRLRSVTQKLQLYLSRSALAAYLSAHIVNSMGIVQ
jgi:hypothetical protein